MIEMGPNDANGGLAIIWAISTCFFDFFLLLTDDSLCFRSYLWYNDVRRWAMIEVGPNDTNSGLAVIWAISTCFFDFFLLLTDDSLCFRSYLWYNDV